MHPGSILFSESKLKNGYLTYFNKSVTSKPFLRDATEVRLQDLYPNYGCHRSADHCSPSQLPLYALLLFGRHLSADPLRGGLSISASTNDKNKKIHLRAPPRTSVLINELRRLMDLELEGLIDDPTSLEGKCVCQFFDIPLFLVLTLTPLTYATDHKSAVIESILTLLRRNGS